MREGGGGSWLASCFDVVLLQGSQRGKRTSRRKKESKHVSRREKQGEGRESIIKVRVGDRVAGMRARAQEKRVERKKGRYTAS